MPIQHNLAATALLIGFALVLTACAQSAPEPQAAVAPQPVAAKFIALSPPKPRPRRVDDGCRLARVDLPADRRTELFQLFDAEHVGADPALPPPRPDPCRPVAR